jgi:competence protein ComFC
MLEYILNLVFPVKCVCCGSIMNYKCDIHICGKCLSDISFFRDDYILIDDIDNLYFDKITSACKYSGILRKSILKYKFGGKPSYYKSLARLVFAKISSLNDYTEAEGFISIPMYRRKKLKRGYNQAELLSKELAVLAGLPDYSGCIIRSKKTTTQSLLNREEREKNVRDAFKVISPDRIMDKIIILVDDVLTTGSTLNECAKELKKAGVLNIYCAVVATGKVSNRDICNKKVKY